MATIHVTPDVMVSTAKNISSKTQEWNASVGRIYKLVEEMDGMWDGLGNDSFNQVFAEEHPKFTKLSVLLNDYIQAIEKAAARYRQGEEEVKNIVTRRK